MNAFQKLRYISLSLLLGLACSSVRAQNTPNLSQTAVPGTSTVTVPLPASNIKSKVNYTRTYIPKVRRSTPIESMYLSQPDPTKVAITTTYTNAHGATDQQVNNYTYKTSSGNYQHTVAPVDTRITGGNQYSFQPYSSSLAFYNNNALSGSVNYHNASRYPEEATGISSPGVISVGQTINTSTPTERSVTTQAPGKSRIGQGRGTVTTSILNAGYDAAFKPEANIRLWSISNGLPVSSSIYGNGTLVGNRITNADGSIKVAFSDRKGKLIYECNLLSSTSDINGVTNIYGITYYVYDDFDRLRFTITPKATDAIKSNWVMTTAILQELCFEYQYDAMGRQVAIHKPGETGFTELVYDKAGKTVMRRSPLEASMGKWELVFHDNSNRVIATGLLTDNNTRAFWQAQAQSQGSSATSSQPHYYIWGAGKGTLPPGTGITNTEILSYNYYDDYTNAPLSSQSFSSSFIQPWLSTNATAEAYVQGNSTYGRLTGTAVKIIKAPGATTGLQDWIYSKVYYDSLGRPIYTLSQNASGAIDTSAIQYNYTGQILTEVLSHNATVTGGNVRSLQITSNLYEDYSGRLQESSRKINNKGWERMVKFTYDELGRILTKEVGNGAETQTFTYTVRGELKGINEQYALTGDKGGKGVTFGEALRYDYGYELARYDGLPTGMVWRGSGGSNVTANAYGYWYDKAGRMTNAFYNEAAATGSNVPTSWTIANKNFLESASYDVNGNILRMNRSGVIPGTQTPVALDRLVYTYQTNSNKIDKVIDQNTSNYGVGDFQQGTAQGYSYDVSGNLTEDKSKNITGITYTSFNKPQVITFGNGYKIYYSYDAKGNKVQELMAEASTTKLNYLANGLYKNDILQQLSTAEGRTDMTKTTPQEQFFVKDHLGNIRSIVSSSQTSEVIPGGMMAQQYQASNELANANNEEQIFDNLSAVREDKPGSLSTSDTKAAELDGSYPEKMVASTILLKVMEGDKLHIDAISLYNSLGDKSTNPENNIVAQIISSVAGVSGSLPPGELGVGTDMANQMFNSAEALQAFESLKEAATDPRAPKAYLNYLFFDERMQLQPQHSQLWQATGADEWAAVGMQQEETIVAPQNGYVAVYLSNESQMPAYFDNMLVSQEPGILIEEKHYYPYGLPMAGMGSAAAGSLTNRQRYQGNEYREELNLRWMDFHNRQYDPQLGRFLSIDPMADDDGQQVLSPYHAMSCNPVTTVDPLGLKGLEVMSVGMQIMTPQEIAYWSGGNHAFDQFQEALDFNNLVHELTSDALQGDEQESGYASSNSDGSAGSMESASGTTTSSSDEDQVAMAPGGAVSIPLSGVFAEYLKEVTFTTGLEVSIDLAATAAFAARSLSLTVTAVAMPLTAGAGSSLDAREASLYKMACEIAGRTGAVPKSYVHGNSNKNQNTHGVYVIYTGSPFGIDMTVQKYGITGNVDFPQNRPQYQVNKFNRESKDGSVYGWRWVAYPVPGREMAKMVELYYVTQYFMTTGNWVDLPPKQFQPDPRKNPTYIKR
ncbi:RHS repeat-associated core domain-containing protein [Sphingobacterium sp.]|uniref:RHS repeat-associated core domain-containing protein n=1 Tax=Sphingobacterium sp. TaxID=341027 RepID=UPI0031DAD78A